MKITLGLFVGTLLVGALAAAAAVHEVGPPNLALARQDSSEGAAVYQAKCASCHQADGAGIPGAFPPLAGNPDAADAAYVESVVTGGLSGSIEALGATFNSVMPAVDLSSDELAAVVAYVGTLSAGGGEPTPTTAAPALAADPTNGKKLFKGAVGFSAGGSACAACHSAGDVGFRGGSGLGPDLSRAFDRLGGTAGLSAWLSSPASETMQPLFNDEPLTQGEIADVTAFLATTTGATRRGGVDQLLVGAGVGLLVLLGLMAVIIRGPNETYNRRLRRER